METTFLTNQWRGRVNAYAPLLFWIGVVFYLSSSFGAFSETSRFIGPLLRFLFPEAPAEILAQYHGFIRKMAHLAVYAVLAFLAVRTLTLRTKVTAAWLVFFSMLLVLFIGCLDELNQSFLSTRTGTLFDVLVDLAGGLVGSMVGFVYYRRRPAAPTRE